MSSHLWNAAHLVDVTKAEFVSSIRIEVQTHALIGIGWIKLGDEWIAIARLLEERMDESPPPSQSPPASGIDYADLPASS